jgi:hypothetical protein
LLETVQANDLWIEDRNFCTREFLCDIDNRGAGFIVRQHAGLPYEIVSALRSAGRVETGRVAEQRVRVQDAQGNWHVFRRLRITLDEATRDGDRVLYILTNLPRHRASTKRVARLYRKRWTLETAFQHLEAYFHAEINTLGYPKAALFTFCLALLAYNAVSLIKAALRSAHGRKKINDEVSGYYLSLEIGRTYDGMMIAIPAPHWQCFRELSAREFAEALRELASSVKLSRYQKHPRGPKKKPPERTPYENGKHVSTAKLLAMR